MHIQDSNARVDQELVRHLGFRYDKLIERDNPELVWLSTGVARSFVNRVLALLKAYEGASFWGMSNYSVATLQARKEFGFDA